jgi:hypothetical protein
VLPSWVVCEFCAVVTGYNHKNPVREFTDESVSVTGLVRINSSSCPSFTFFSIPGTGLPSLVLYAPPFCSS